ncbi:conjugative transposon protein TraM [Flavobacterium sp. CSZ]|uniref:conjugative transposon protein TraM n=1 Tax=Flavobacterium sp. CSZ TaxID=2783791 RepID=UPI00188B94F6|nr:conjugative transposon protein TraM [Flavobacterium sp. CSZ]MBF4487767.1 conjugative transposon protein TraM [Flavobacterium sp. CSZ]
MERKTISIKELKKRKMLLVLLLLALPFITLLFWSLGGGKEPTISAEILEKRKFNTALPGPEFKEEITLDKLSYYQKAAMDSLKRSEQMRKDPNYSSTLLIGDSISGWSKGPEMRSFPRGKSGLNTFSYQDQNTKKVYQKLQALQKAIEQPSVGEKQEHDMREFEHYGSSPESEDMRKLEQLISVMGQPQGEDPELRQLGGMLENILDIQHPARMQEKLNKASEGRKEKALRVVRKNGQNNLAAIDNYVGNEQMALQSNSFYSLQQVDTTHQGQNAIEAVIHLTQSIVDGSLVKLRLCNEVLIQGVEIPRNSFLFGTALLKAERLEIKITNIKYGNSIFPVELAVYDLDGIEGIYIPGAINRDVAKASADRSIQTLGVASLTDSWGAQAAGMGIEAAKSLMSKKVKLIKVMVKAGYRVLLYDKKQNNSH